MENLKWIFSGIGVFVVSGICFLIRIWFKGKKNNIDNHANFQNYDIEYLKRNTNILFVDDDRYFKVVKILKGIGWQNTKWLKDIDNLDDIDVRAADIMFIDINGVGNSLGFVDEGLGLALALKKRYEDKKIIIYSAETKGERFHEGLRSADTFLPKNAEPYEFQQIIEDYSQELIASKGLAV